MTPVPVITPDAFGHTPQAHGVVQGLTQPPGLEPTSAGSHEYAGADGTTAATVRLLTEEAQRCGDRLLGAVQGLASYLRGVHTGVRALSSTLVSVTLLGGLALPEFEVPAQSSQRTVQGETVPVEPRESSLCEPVQGWFPWDLDAAAESRGPPSTVSGCSGHGLGRSARHPHPAAARAEGACRPGPALRSAECL